MCFFYTFVEMCSYIAYICSTINTMLIFLIFILMRKIYIFSVFVSALMSAAIFESCSSCAEEALSEVYDVNVDLDGDGDQGDRSGRDNSQEVSFRGYKSCNIPGHHCPGGYDGDNNGYCDNCKANANVDCEMAYHH